MNYITMRAKYVVSFVTFTDIKANGSRDIHTIKEIARFEDRGSAELFSKQMNDTYTRLISSTVCDGYKVMTMNEAKRFKEICS